MNDASTRKFISWESVVRAAKDIQSAADRGALGKRDADRLAALVLLFHAQTTMVLNTRGSALARTA